MKTDSPSSKTTAEPVASTPAVVSAEDTAVKALERIAQLDLQPVPQVYELWFRYFQGDPEIVRAVDNHQGALDEMVHGPLILAYAPVFGNLPRESYGTEKEWTKTSSPAWRIGTTAVSFFSSGVFWRLITVTRATVKSSRGPEP